uniref:Uncharacterized protein n=1 Tax=Lactuca sativa TaxID=4236 RepID=A0A9R1UU58_LACSA|nr:hypothetical protein LSAT_V11C800449830 [Lactuca sativa]
MLLFFVQHDYNNFNVKAIVKGSGWNIWEVFDVLDGARREIIRDTVFGYLLDVPRLQLDGLLFHKMFLHQIRSDAVLSPDGIKRLYFRVGDMKMVYGPEEFCLIIGLNFGDFAWGSYLWDFTYKDLEDTWNKINKYLSLPERRQTLKYSISRFTAPFRIWIYEMLPAVRVTPPNQTTETSEGLRDID